MDLAVVDSDMFLGLGLQLEGFLGPWTPVHTYFHTRSQTGSRAVPTQPVPPKRLSRGTWIWPTRPQNDWAFLLYISCSTTVFVQVTRLQRAWTRITMEHAHDSHSASPVECFHSSNAKQLARQSFTCFQSPTTGTQRTQPYYLSWLS